VVPPGGERLPRLAPPGLDDDQAAVYDEIAHGPRAKGRSGQALRDEDGALVGPFNAMVVAPRIGLHLQRLGSAIRYEGALSPRARELAILLCARYEHSAFEWYAHEPAALAAGAGEAALDAILSGAELRLDDPVDQTVVRVATSLLETGDVSDGAHRDAKGMLSDAQLVEIVVLVGYYRMLSVLLRAFRVELPPGVSTPFSGEGAGEAPSA
jgi:4-carboxymuconolactone decarboxylase